MCLHFSIHSCTPKECISQALNGYQVFPLLLLLKWLILNGTRILAVDTLLQFAMQSHNEDVD